MFYPSNQKILLFCFTTSLIALIAAYVSQYVFGLQPCNLCLWQRKPFFFIIIISALFLTVPNLKKYQIYGIWINILAFLTNAIIAFYHMGVEKGWFEGLDSCTSAATDANNIEDLIIILENSAIVRCDEPQFIFLNLSMAGWNVLYCLGLAVLIGVLVRRSAFEKFTNLIKKTGRF